MPTTNGVQLGGSHRAGFDAKEYLPVTDAVAERQLRSVGFVELGIGVPTGCQPTRPAPPVVAVLMHG
jgi:hypothetical protein